VCVLGTRIVLQKTYEIPGRIQRRTKARAGLRQAFALRLCQPKAIRPAKHPIPRAPRWRALRTTARPDSIRPLYDRVGNTFRDFHRPIGYPDPGI
jgi:hypothetical protein